MNSKSPTNEIAQYLHNAFLKGLNQKCKDIIDLKDVEIFFDESLFRVNKTGWYCFTDKYNDTMFGCSVDIPGTMSKAGAIGIVVLIKEMS